MSKAWHQWLMYPVNVPSKAHSCPGVFESFQGKRSQGVACSCKCIECLLCLTWTGSRLQISRELFAYLAEIVQLRRRLCNSFARLRIEMSNASALKLCWDGRERRHCAVGVVRECATHNTRQSNMKLSKACLGWCWLSHSQGIGNTFGTWV